MGSTRSGASKTGSSEAGSKSVPPTRQVADSTATGMQIQHESGQQFIPKGKDAGSPVPIQGKEPEPDFLGKGNKPTGLQAEKALFVSNGSVPSDVVATPTGPQPIGAIATSPEHGEQLMKDHREQHQRFIDKTKAPARHRLDEATIGRLTRAELKAIGDQRGYDIPDAGTRATRAAFLRDQGNDKEITGGSVAKGRKGTKGGGKGSSQQASEGVSNAQMDATTKRTAPKKTSNSGRGGRRGTNQ